MTTGYSDRGVSLNVFRPLRYSDIVDNLQNIIWSIMRNDSTVTSFTTNILDNEPVKLYEGSGFPYIIVKTPELQEGKKRVSVRGVRRITMSVEIRCWYKKQGNLRAVVDAIRSALEENQLDTIRNHAYNLRLPRVTNNEKALPSGEVVYFHSVFAEYETVK